MLVVTASSGLTLQSSRYRTGTGFIWVWGSNRSSFAALTMVATQALSELTGKDLLSWEQQSQFSRTGSGSSIRSFYSPWALWRGDTCYNIELPYPELIHQVILIKSEPKKISSSEAHRLIETSPIFAKRMKTVELKLDDLVTAMACKDWKVAYEIVRDEFIEMHELFHTCEKPFSYMQDESKQIIAEVDAHWQQHGDGPMITMDAGPNIHLVYRPDQAELADQFKTQYGARFDVI